MPVGEKGQFITFSVDQDPDEHFSRYVWIHTRVGDTVAKIAARRGHPELARTIAKLNGLRNIYANLHSRRVPPSGGVGLPFGNSPERRRLRLPGIMRQRDVVNVLADDPPPLIKDGYAMYDIVNVPGRRGISRFLGFNPVSMDVPIQWDEWTTGDGTGVETDITRLQRMAGRGDYPGAAAGPPAVIRVSVTDNYGHVVPLVPRDYQWMPSAHGMLYRISALQWDPNPLRRGPGPGRGRRLRQKAVVTVTEYTPVHVAERSASRRSRTRNAGKAQAAASGGASE